MNFGLESKSVVIVGGDSGIGFEVAKGFKEQGAHVTITSEKEDVFAAGKQLNEMSGTAVKALQFDITGREEVTAAFGQLGDIDILVNNAGVFWDTPSSQPTTEVYDAFVKQLMINVVGGWWCTLEAVPHMKPGGRVIFTSSISGSIGSPHHSSYSASKHAVLGMMKSLAMDLGPLGITVNAVSPGSTATEMNLKALPADVQALIARVMPLHPGLLAPKDHVGTFLFLASEAASEITGQSIIVDRGQTIMSAGAA